MSKPERLYHKLRTNASYDLEELCQIFIDYFNQPFAKTDVVKLYKIVEEINKITPQVLSNLFDYIVK